MELDQAPGKNFVETAGSASKRPIWAAKP